jgi:hypothetical protein
MYGTGIDKAELVEIYKEVDCVEFYDTKTVSCLIPCAICPSTPQVVYFGVIFWKEGGMCVVAWYCTEIFVANLGKYTRRLTVCNLRTPKLGLGCILVAISREPKMRFFMARSDVLRWIGL